jgi:hypothetical protein
MGGGGGFLSKRTSFDIIKLVAERHGNEPAICKWVSFMLESREPITILSAQILRASMPKGCLQRGVL